LSQAVRLIGQIIVDGRLFNLPGLYSIRILTYKLLFNIGKNVRINNGLYINREHKKMTGFVKIGNNVRFGGSIHLDYTGFLTIKDGAVFADGVKVLTHHRDLEEYAKGNDVNIQTSLVIEEKAYIGTNVIILSSCNYIGKNSRIGAGAVVTKDVPDNVLVGGIPAKVIKQL
jgi:acetyltransferase-like isoleucine patch superfamily enzyme